MLNMIKRLKWKMLAIPRAKPRMIQSTPSLGHKSQSDVPLLAQMIATVWSELPDQNNTPAPLLNAVIGRIVEFGCLTIARRYLETRVSKHCAIIPQERPTEVSRSELLLERHVDRLCSPADMHRRCCRSCMGRGAQGAQGAQVSRDVVN